MSFRHTRLGLAAAAICVMAGATSAVAAPSGPSTGRLSCTIGSGLGAIVKSQRPMDCRFRPRRGPVQSYTGVVRQYGLDLGSIRGTRMSWRVYGPYARAPLGALRGSYTGVTAQASAGAGAGLVALTGGPDNEVTLRPLSVQTLRGINVAIGVTALDLTLNPPGRRR